MIFLTVERFWDMFIIDALNGNLDRHGGNWGFLKKENQYILAPAYDNGSSMYPRLNTDEQLLNVLNSESERNKRVYQFPTSQIKLNGKKRLDYYDRFEWLLRTDRVCGDDNLIVERMREEATTFEKADAKTINLVQPGDKIILNRLCDIAPNKKMLSESLFRLLQSGATVSVKEDNVTFSAELCPSPLYILERMMEYSKLYDDMRRKEGIEQAKEDNKYKGRKPIKVDALVFEDVADKFEKGIIVESLALEKLSMSRSTFYRRLKEYKKRNEEVCKAKVSNLRPLKVKTYR